MKRFADRQKAGEALAETICLQSTDRKGLVLALPRGGVPVAAPIAHSLKVPLDVLVVRKLGVPGWEELAAGAIGSGGVEVLNRDIVDHFHLTDVGLEPVRQRELQELQRRERLYRGNRPQLNLEGSTVFLVDDGVATGATMQAAVLLAKQLGAARVVVAVPHSSREALEALQVQADEVICLQVPDPYEAVGRWYLDFSEVGDDEVRALLAEAPGQS
ncbi:phosphoribosyltransferase [Deinococcus cellulosilyticus]|uniref:Phosphoribosyl transferase n=1 Tax=Deinococcus cellulosilyticus (strain DSM 18568 / NBRC 106333 / KACC 11606 / 5516J-15) TaxID=1223518 RepID=A0A511MY15_DEIC1|nr:phosphoribosyltransferase [Deinococcus cellulosilyticus]GEM45482.1 phosphoribosyl transferase [Deinococcus cellulosilyticus NBRC 106333 = KACC 11606]